MEKITSMYRAGSYSHCRYEFHGANGREEKKATLDEKDNIWTDIRHMHMKDTIDKLMQDFNKFCQENTNFTDKFDT
jgi:syntaxin-binding protein 1